ncbi:hypothetical protein [Winogradskyella sp.]|uniref:hypothetical protein n=1 Tax=Winogradskyella sp. TaxID=1883156 RepID=UPI00260F418D|nr:hypothetical protein [Winogradskyella sp.]
MKKLNILLIVLMISFLGFSQEDEDTQRSVIQEYTPSILLKKGQWDIKWFNNLYTQTESTFTDGTEPRETYLTSTLEIFTGVSENSSFNLGLLLEFRTNVVADRNSFEVFQFDGEFGTARSGFTSFAPAIKFNPIKSVGNFTIQTALHIPLVDNEVEDIILDDQGNQLNNGVFLDQNGFFIQNRFFYDYSFADGDWQIFTELNTEYSFPKDDSLWDNSLRLSPGVFLSYFPSSKFTVLGLVQHTQLLAFETDGFEQDFTALGGGAKYQLTDELNVELLYTNFVRGNDTGLGQTFNIGLRALF